MNREPGEIKRKPTEVGSHNKKEQGIQRGQLGGYPNVPPPLRVVAHSILCEDSSNVETRNFNGVRRTQCFSCGAYVDN